MTTNDLLGELHKQREALNAAIALIENLLAGSNHVAKQASLVKSIKAYRKRKPWNKGKKTGRKWTPEQRAKFVATMKERYGKKKEK